MAIESKANVVPYEHQLDKSAFLNLMENMPDRARSCIMEAATLSVSAFLSDMEYQAKVAEQLGPDKTKWPTEAPKEILQGTRTRAQVEEHLARLLQAITGVYDDPKAAQELANGLASVLLGSLMADGLIIEHISGTLSSIKCRDACCQKAANELPC